MSRVWRRLWVRSSELPVSCAPFHTLKHALGGSDWAFLGTKHALRSFSVRQIRLRLAELASRWTSRSLSSPEIRRRLALFYSLSCAALPIVRQQRKYIWQFEPINSLRFVWICPANENISTVRTPRLTKRAFSKRTAVLRSSGSESAPRENI
jgi:hypothetical protein